MSSSTDRYFLGVVKLNLPLKVERVELAPLVFVPGFVIAMFALAFIAYVLYYDPATARPIKGYLRPSREIGVSNNIGGEDTGEDLGQYGEDDYSIEETVDYDGDPAEVSTDMAKIYAQNNDCVGWLTIDGTVMWILRFISHSNHC